MRRIVSVGTLVVALALALGPAAASGATTVKHWYSQHHELVSRLGGRLQRAYRGVDALLASPDPHTIAVVLGACSALSTATGRVEVVAQNVERGPSRQALEALLRAASAYVADCLTLAQVETAGDASKVFAKLVTDTRAARSAYARVSATLPSAAAGGSPRGRVTTTS